MLRLELLTSEDPSALLDRVVADVVSDGDRACLVIARVPLQRDVIQRVVEMVPSGAWAGPKVVSLDSLVEHYALQLDPSRTLTALQVRQVIAAIILDLHAESGGKRFKGNVVGSRVGDATLRSLTRLFADLEPFGWTAEALEEALRGQNPGVPALSDRASVLAEVYRRYLQRMRAEAFVGPKGRAISAAEQARLVPPPFGVSSFTFLGFDAVSPMDVGIRLAAGLCVRADVSRVRLALVMPDEALVSAWPTHANDALVNRWSDLGGSVRTIVSGSQRVAPDLHALATDPFAYRRPPAALTGAVRAVVVPDRQLQIDWLANEIKRSLLADPTLRPSDVAIIARRTEDIATNVVQALTDRGLPA